MGELCVASGLVMNKETGALERPDYLPGFQDGECQTDLRGDRDSQLFSVGLALVRNRLAGFLQAPKMTQNCVAGHRKRFLFVATEGDHPRKQWHSHLVARQFFRLPHYLRSCSFGVTLLGDGSQDDGKIV